MPFRKPRNNRNRLPAGYFTGQPLFYAYVNVQIVHIPLIHLYAQEDYHLHQLIKWKYESYKNSYRQNLETLTAIIATMPEERRNAHERLVEDIESNYYYIMATLGYRLEGMEQSYKNYFQFACVNGNFNNPNLISYWDGIRVHYYNFTEKLLSEIQTLSRYCMERIEIAQQPANNILSLTDSTSTDTNPPPQTTD